LEKIHSLLLFKYLKRKCGRPRSVCE